MSRVDEALRRAASDVAILRAPVAVEPAAAAVDQTALDRYAAEPQPREREKPAAAPPPPVSVRPAVDPRATVAAAPPADVLIPHARGSLAAFHRSLEGKVVTSRATSPVSIEQYRRLAVALIAAQAERGIKTLMVSSSVPHEGKTLTITNLAVTLSESYGRNVLLIDADMRRPCVHELFGLPNAFGLAEVLRAPDAPIAPIEISPKLHVLPAGQGDDGAMAQLSSDRMRALIADAASRFDWVLVDTPPIGLLSDANLVARVTEAVLFVIAAGGTPFHVVQKGIDEIGADRIIGTVLNRVGDQALNVHDYYGRYYPR
jgi:capsular exopolysaccharide synthesis family protein